MAAALVLWPAVRLRIEEEHDAIVLARAGRALDDPSLFPVRIAAPTHRTADRIARLLRAPSSMAAHRELTSSLLRISRGASGVAAARAAGLAHVLGGEPTRAVESFTSIPARQRTWNDWSNIAAVEATAAVHGSDDGRWLQALAAADRALVIAPDAPAAHFNRAVALDGIGLTFAASKEWRAYVTLDRESRWASIARQRLTRIGATELERWRAEFDRARDASPAQVRALAERFPQTARAYALGPALADWAKARDNGDLATAGRALSLARIVGDVVRRNADDGLLAESVAAIDGRSSVDPLVRGHLAYRRGREALNRNDDTAERELRAAVAAFDEGASPMATDARYWIGALLVHQNRVPEALSALTALLTSERASMRHPILVARIQHELSLCHAIVGNWSDSLAAADEAMRIFQRSGERGSAAEAEAVLSEDFDFLGQANRARQHGIISLRAQCAYGDVRRIRATLAALARTELRQTHWAVARSLIQIETDLRPSMPEPLLDTDLFLRRATADLHLGDEAATARTIAMARRSASSVTDVTQRKRLLGDVDAAEGTIARLEHPVRAAALLSKAIAVQRQLQRPIVLPELYLQRGRAFEAIGDVAAAQRDYDAGISALEEQRAAVADAELRPGIFDDASGLFDADLDLQLRRGASPAAAFEHLERGRARTALEQMSGTLRPPIATVADVQRSLVPGGALLEYACLRDRILIITITRTAVNATVVAQSRATVQAMVRELVTRLSGRTGAATAREISAPFYDSFLRPAEPFLLGISAVTIVADDLLSQVPFAALFDRARGTYFIERATVSMAPSAGVFVAVRARSRRSIRGGPRTAVVFANPTPPAAFASLPSLPSAENEGRRIGNMYQHSSFFSGDSATAERFMTMTPQCDIIHFAGHAVTSRSGGVSALICASSSARPGMLSGSTIAKIPLRARLVLLAACSTSSGRNAAVEGVSSLSRAFLIGGAGAVIGTLWDIDDRDATPLMAGLHAKVARGASPATALRDVQIAAIRDSRGRDRQTWAAFSVMGGS